MSLYVIGDLHLSMSPDVDKPMEIYGPLWLNHEERLEEYWREYVTSEDTVIIPGDISWGLKYSEAEPDLEWLDKLPGRKIIFKGNHDLWWAGIKKLNSAFETITFLQNDCAFCEGVYICGSRGWITPDNDEFSESDEKIYNREYLRLQLSLEHAAQLQKEEPGEIIAFLHFPPVSKFSAFSKFMQAFMDYNVKEVYYGHVHGQEGFKNTIQGNYHGVEYKLVSLDYLKCKPYKIR